MTGIDKDTRGALRDFANSVSTIAVGSVNSIGFQSAAHLLGSAEQYLVKWMNLLQLT